MRLLNCGLHEIKEKFGDRKIIFFGCGSWLSAIKHTEFESLKHNFAYAVDNDNSIDSFSLGDDICLKVFLPERLKEETECIVVLTSPVYSYEMYRQLETMHLADGIICYVFAFMQMVTPDYEDKAMLEYIFDNSRTPQIPQTIHSFWFSGEKKPDSYQRCVDSWYRKLDGYEIIEWNMDNYNYHKHPFLERAIELGAWAFAADYARLDVLYEQGGIYLDMDVEVFKSFDNLLANDAILSFSNHVMVDLAVAGAKKGNQLIGTLLKMYDMAKIPEKKQGFNCYFQPIFVRDALADAGVSMNGSLQVIKDAVIFPRRFFMGMDCVLFNGFKKNDDTYCVHYDNFGWSFDVENRQKKKKRDNNLLWGLVENG